MNTLRFRSIEKIVNDLIIKTADYCYNNWTLHAVGTTSDHQFMFLLTDAEGHEARIGIDCFEKEDGNHA